jgi:hypothetical protein
VVGVPAAADIRLLIWPLPHLGYFRIPGDRLEEAVDIDRPKGARKSQMLLRCECLIAKENHTMIG